ncbi:putative transcription factor interactor and regulator CCHC(Zn) family [Helianthus debilis subsp. tardiflorus]
MLHCRQPLSQALICMVIQCKFLLSHLLPQICMEIQFNHLLLLKHAMEVHHLLVNKKPETVRLNTSSFSKVSVEVAKEHMELLNTLVSAYCGLVEGQIGNINLTQEDYQQIDKEEMELMDIKWAFASAIRRAKDYMERTGRTSLESKKDTKYGSDKQAVKCFNCSERGHFKRECTRPAQHGNQNPYRGQGNRANQNQARNNERTLVPVGNQSQAGPSNANQALVVQVDESCDWSIQLSGDAPDGTTCFAEVVKDLVHTSGGESSANGGESSEDEDSSGYSRSSDEESSGSDDVLRLMLILMNFWRKLQQELIEDLFWWIKLLTLRLLSIQPLWLMSTVHQVRFLAFADSKGKENMVDDKLWNEDTT